MHHRRSAPCTNSSTLRRAASIPATSTVLVCVRAGQATSRPPYRSPRVAAFVLPGAYLAEASEATGVHLWANLRGVLERRCDRDSVGPGGLGESVVVGDDPVEVVTEAQGRREVDGVEAT